MSDEFIKLATQEINQEISGISDILSSCKNNDEVIKQATPIERHVHKIKGLAPMMGQEGLGELASELDFVLKKIIGGMNIQFFDEISASVDAMKLSMVSSDYDLSEMKKRIRAISVHLH